MINLVSIYSNVFRAAEIAACGRHSIYLVPVENCDEVTPSGLDMIRLKTEIERMFLLIDDSGNNVDGVESALFRRPVFADSIAADMVIEVCAPDANTIIKALDSKFVESVSDIAARIRNTIKQEKQDFDTKLNRSCEALLKTAIQRLRLCISDVESILGVAVTIAKMSGSPLIYAEHMAEAIQYKSCQP